MNLTKLKELALAANALPADAGIAAEDAAMKALHDWLPADTVLELIALVERQEADLAAEPATPAPAMGEELPQDEHRENCPFCGSANISDGEVVTEDQAKECVTQSMCEDCGAMGPGAALGPDEVDYGDVKARAAWNRRACMALRQPASAQPVAAPATISNERIAQLWKDLGGDNYPAATRFARALLAEAVPAVAEGWKIVPIAAPISLIVAIETEICNQLHASGSSAADMIRMDGDLVWDAALAAASSAPVGGSHG